MWWITNVTNKSTIRSIPDRSILNLNPFNQNGTAQNELSLNDTGEYTFENLDPGERYEVEILLIFLFHEVEKNGSVSLNFSTISTNEKLEKPLSFEVTKLVSSESDNFNLVVQWMPNKHYPTCTYKIGYKTQALHFDYSFPMTKTIVVDMLKTKKNEATLKNFQYSKTYDIWIKPIIRKNEGLDDIEGNSLAIIFPEEYCSNSILSRNNSFPLCSPLKIENLTGSSDCTYSPFCNISISWYMSSISLADYFIIDIKQLYPTNGTQISKNVTGDTTSCTFSNISLGSYYRFNIIPIKENKKTEEYKAFIDSGCIHFLYETNRLVTRVEEESKCIRRSSSVCETSITWETKDIFSDYVIINIEQILPKKSSQITEKINQIETKSTVSFPNIDLGSVYRFNFTAYFNGSKISECSRIRSPVIVNQDHEFNYYYYTSMFLITVVLLWSIYTRMIQLKNQKLNKEGLKKKYKLQVKNIETLHCVKIKKDKDIREYHLILGEILGTGAFGIVFKGTLKLSNEKILQVAVKTLRDNATTKEIQQFEKEIHLMENVGFHRNIVSMIGFCYNENKPLLVVEFCPLGDLHTYLRQYWKYLTKVQYSNLTSKNHQYENLKSKSFGLTEYSLLSFARQVAIGMVYLASNYVVHRDLAARNVLLCDDRTVKISDFGLSRDIYTENIYRKLVGNELMPIKWMALESIRFQEYTTQTDVWSFGTFLWELFTLCDEPYADITCPEVLLLRLKEGYRMECPPAANPELYQIMLNCWDEVPSLRPSFSMLHEQLDHLLNLSSPNQYLPLI